MGRKRTSILAGAALLAAALLGASTARPATAATLTDSVSISATAGLARSRRTGSG